MLIKPAAAVCAELAEIHPSGVITMNLPPPPEYVSELSDWQREKLCDFVDQVHQIVEGVHYERDEELCDAELLASALRCCLYRGIDPSKLDQFFTEQFGIANISEGPISELLPRLMMMDVEKRIKAAAGGRN